MDLNENQRWLLDELFDGLYILDMNGAIVFWNRAAEEMTGFSRNEVVGKSCADNLLMHVDEGGTALCGAGCPMKAAREEGTSLNADVYLHHKDGHRIPVAVRAAPMRGKDGEIVASIEVFTDRSRHEDARKRLDELQRLALHDELTGLPNRRFLNHHLVAKAAELERVDLPFGVLMIDIDHFKKVNDTYGHDAGDHVLRTVARTMAGAVRPYDSIGRWGGEEFLSVASFADAVQLSALAERLRFLVETSRPVFNGCLIPVTISIGGTCAKKSDDAEAVIKRADQLLYASKRGGRNRTAIS